MRRAIDGAGYKEVKTPQVMDARQWEASGHWGKYRENMFVIPDEVPNVEDEGPLVSDDADKSEEHTSELQSLMRISYAVFCLKKKTTQHKDNSDHIELHQI